MDEDQENITNVYGEVCFRKQRRKRQKLLVTELLFDYAQNSTLHGLRYIVSRGLSIIEKLFWFITFASSIVLCSYCVFNLYIKWKTSPVIVTVNERQASVGAVPFPAVTICPQIKVKHTEYNYEENREKLNNGSFFIGVNSFKQKELLKFLHIQPLCETGFVKQALLSAVKYTDVSLIDDITQVSPTSDDVFFFCHWYENNNIRQHSDGCKKLFSRVYTEQGVCYTTNTLAARDIFEDSIQRNYSYLLSNNSIEGWSQETGYNLSFETVFPRRGHYLGSLPDVEIILTYNPNHKDKMCNSHHVGFKIFLQHPTDFPQPSLYYYAALPNQLTSLAVSFHQFNTDRALSKYPPEIRQCYFQEDRKLRYFKMYTMKNCQAECLSNLTFKHCGCVGFYMPHDNSNQLCSVGKYNCLWGSKETMAKNEIQASLGHSDGACNCLPACNTIEYDAEILKTDYFPRDDISRSVYYTEKHKNISFSKIDLYFKKPQFVTMQRRELFGVLDLLANIGGLLGLFLGFSFLSLIEIFYFLTMRIGFTLKRDLETEKAEKKQDNIIAIDKK